MLGIDWKKYLLGLTGILFSSPFVLLFLLPSLLLSLSVYGDQTLELHCGKFFEFGLLL